MTALMDLLNDGVKVQVSEYVQQGTSFSHDDPPLVVVHPLDYSYMAHDDIFAAHRTNVLWINRHINEMAAHAVGRLDRMVEEMNRKHLPSEIRFFAPASVTENEDGTFTFQIGGPSEEQVDLAQAMVNGSVQMEKVGEALDGLGEAARSTTDAAKEFADQWASLTQPYSREESEFDDLLKGDNDEQDPPSLLPEPRRDLQAVVLEASLALVSHVRGWFRGRSR